MQCRFELAGILAAGLLLAGGAKAAPSEVPRHVVIVTIDTLRQDRLGVYGHARAQTPHLDALAARGIRFDDAIAQATITPPSHATIFTGLNPVTHGLTFLYGQRLDARHRTLAEVLRDTGFETAAFVSAAPLRRETGLAQGFGVYDDALGEGRKTRSARQTNTQVERWLQRAHPGRVFLWVHYFEPHHPYLAPEPYRSRLAEAGDLGAKALNGNPASGKNLTLPQAEVEEASRLYDGEVAATDAAVGELLETLGRAGLLSEAIVAVVSDHGESLGERRYYFGHWDVFDETARIPMLVAHPAGSWAGTTISSTVGSLDLMPTLLGWLGVPVPAAIEGRDLTPLLEGADAPQRRVFYTERGMSRKRVVRSVRDDRWLLIEHANWKKRHGTGGDAPVRLYDRATGDPAGSEMQRERERLTAALDVFRSRAAAAEPPAPHVISDETAEQLRALGYEIPKTPER